MQLSLVLPAYNEAELLPRVIPELRRALAGVSTSFEIIVVDNGSTDTTPNVLAKLRTTIPELVVVRVFPNQGYGNGILAGLAVAKGDAVGWTDADDQLSADDIAKVYREMMTKGASFSKGNRTFQHQPSFLWLRSRLYTVLFILLFGPLTRDAQGSPRFFNRSLYEKLHLSSRDWFIASEGIIKAGRLGVKPLEIPVRWQNRSGGISKVRLGTTLEFVKNALRYRFSRHE
jgi:glycosyltransferase involved in cell wall biosynthesis